MRSISLGQLFELKYGKSLRKDKRVQGEVPVYGSNGTVDYHNESLVHKATIVVGRKGSIGEVHLVATPCWPIDTTYFVESRGKYDYDLEWLYRLLKTLRLQDLNRSAAIPGLNRDDVYRIKIRLPPIADQKRIAHLLGKVEGLIARRKQHLQQLDDLLKSVFMEMFGDPTQWELIPLESIAKKGRGTFTNGPFGSNLLTSELADIGVPVIYIRDIRDAEYRRVSRVCVTREKAEELQTCQVYPEDILIAKVGDPPGTSAIYPKDEPVGVITQDVIRIRPDLKKVNPFFVSGYLNSIYGIRMIREITVEATRARFGLRDFKAQKIPRPPIELQNQFSVIVKKIESLKSSYQHSLTDLETLYGALSQKAFKGELDLSRVVLPMDEEVLAEVMEPITTKLPDTQPVIELPAPDSVAGFFSAKGRKALIAKWLEVYLELLGSRPFSAQHFMETAQQRLAELLEELQEPESLTTDYEFFRFGPHEYDHVKELIFQALESGRLAQTYDEAGNLVQLTMAKG
ncbi:MAG: restriction endonuclease subunit S [Proteobacteria bacterium]|nr:restriction endonuclease subunit S [Pseudomonadota bacterium]MCG2747360.1 restriction endonuclease subunit S [Desulfobulbaceae bacterium]